MERSELFRFIVDYASDAMVPVDTYGKIVSWNKAAGIIIISNTPFAMRQQNSEF